MPRRRAHYVLSTHWDREWYRPFQEYRLRLARLLDAVLDGLADGRLRGPFTCDGQSILAEDYLELRPERRGQLIDMARAGKLILGPWYVAPDEFLVSGESLLRNLRRGRRVARELGAAPSAAGVAFDQFGHIGQLPQIFAGLGIGGVFLWRGVNTDERHFRWVGSDGTALPTYRFGRGGYCSFAFDVRHADLPGRQLDDEQIWADLEAFLAAEAARTRVEPLLLLDGGDHLAWDEQVYRVVMGYAEQPDLPFELVHSSLDAYLAELLPSAGRIAHAIAGELREPAARPRAEDEQYLIPGVLSSRVWIKQENAACEALLTCWAEPLSLWAARALGRPLPAGELDLAWRWLLQNHPHDSMGGCSVDAVHADMEYRFRQARQLGELLAEDAARAIAAAASGPLGHEELRLVVFNPLARPLEESAELTVEVPAGWPSFGEFFGFEPKPAFRVFGPDGAEIPYQRLDQQLGAARSRLSPLTFPDLYRVNAVRVSLPLAIPAMGYTSLTVRPGERDPLPDHPGRGPIARPTRHPGRGLASGPRSMANELIELAVAADGTLELTDLRSGARYAGLLAPEDSADIGDGWYHGPPAADEVHGGPGLVEVALLHDGPQLASLRIRRRLSLPARFDFGAMRRSEDRAELTIEHVVSMRPGCDRVEVETSLLNTVADHRLRLRLPSGAAAERYLADGAFDAVERPIGLRPDNHRYRELEVETRPQQSWTAVWGGGRGLAVVAPGLLETAVCDEPERPIALTLLRSTRRTVFTDGEPDGLLLGRRLRFRCWVLPLAAPPEPARLHELGRQLAAGLRTATLAAADRPGDEPASLPPSAGLLALEGPLAISCLAPAAGGAIELRLFNPAASAARGRLTLPPGVASARPASLEGEPAGDPLPLAGGALEIELGPKKILTILLS